VKKGVSLWNTLGEARWRGAAGWLTYASVGKQNTGLVDSNRASGGVFCSTRCARIILLGGCLTACVGAERTLDARAASESETSMPACLASAPIDLSSSVGAPAVAFYVNDLRLGYARGEAIFLSRPLCDLYGWPLCRFVELHEQAHHYMRTVGAKSTCAETLADCWAAMHADEDALNAALDYFRGRHEEEIGYHADSSARRDVISHCARLPRRQLAEAAASGTQG
jgi:hypothetical protein